MGKENRIYLLPKQIDLLVSLPEQGNGFQVVDLELTDGSILTRRVVLNCGILLLNDDENIYPEDIKQIMLHPY